jgi:hypothetical protein
MAQICAVPGSQRNGAAVGDTEAADPNDGRPGRLLADELRRVRDVNERVCGEPGTLKPRMPLK